jgi:hypothetical protein
MMAIATATGLGDSSSSSSRKVLLYRLCSTSAGDDMKKTRLMARGKFFGARKLPN